MSDDLYQHPVILGDETTDLQTSTLSRIGEAFTKGIPAAAISGTLGIANTFLDYTGKQAYDIEEEVRKWDESAGQYYAENQSAVDLVGFVAGSFIPGGAGVKALQLARGGNAVGAVGRALNFASSRRNAAMEQALKEVGKDGGTIRSLVSSAARRRQLGWEVADQALLGVAAESAILATMNDSPVFDKDTYGDFIQNFGIGVLLSGGIGGALGSLGARGILKSAQKEVQAAMRDVDTVLSYEKMGLTKGTELLGFAESIAKLPDSAGNIKFDYAGGSVELPTSDALRAARDRAVKVAEEKLAIEFTNLAEGNATVGQAYFDFIKRGSNAAKETGMDPDEVLNVLTGYLQNVKKVSNIDEAALAADSRKFYANLHPSRNPNDPIEKWSGGAFTTNRAKSRNQEGYMLNEGVESTDLIIANLDELPEQHAKQAFQNHDIDLLRLPNGELRVNPKSPNITRVRENPFIVKKFMDLETGTIMPETTVVFGDTITKDALRFGDDFIAAGRKSFTQSADEVFDLTRAPIEASARWAWASKLEVGNLMKITKGKINVDDLPLMQRVVELESSTSPGTLEKLTFFKDGEAFKAGELGPSLTEAMEAARLDVLQAALNNWDSATHGSVPDTRAMAAHLNTSVDWVEDAITRNFTLPGAGENIRGEVFSTANALKPKTVQVEWDLTPARGQMLPEDAYNMNMGPQNIAVKELTKAYQVEIRSRANKVAAAAVLEDDYGLFIEMDSLSRYTSVEGAGAGTWTASNASYGERAKLAVQDTGAKVQLVSQRRRDAVVETLAPYKEAIVASPTAQIEFGVITTALRKNPNQFHFDDLDSTLMVSKEVADYARVNQVDVHDAIAVLQPKSQHPVSYKLQSSEVADFLRESSNINFLRQDKFATLRRATGLTSEIPQKPVVYAPPIDTVRYPYHAFVRAKEQIGVATDVTMITAKSEDQLRLLASKVDSGRYDVLFKGDTENYFKAKGQYDYSETLSQARVNSDLARTGVLADFFPETRLENVMTDWLRFHANQEEKLVRDAVQVNSRQFFSEMQFLSDTHRLESESVARGIGSKFKKAVADPFGDYIKTALNISKQQEVPLLDSLNEFVDKVGMKAGDAIEKAFGSAKMDGDFNRVNDIAAKHGLGRPYMDVETYVAANERYPKNIVREIVQKANAVLATVTLRFDFANSLLNIISTPIMLGTEMQSIKGLIGKNSELAGKLAELTSVKVPGQNFAAPSTTKLTIGGVQNFFGPQKDALLARYREIGAIKDIGQKYHEMLDSLTYDPTIGASKWKDRVDRGVEIGAKITGNNFSEEFTRFVSADVMRQMTDPLVAAGRMNLKEQNAYIGTFVNRVQGNYVTSQRPLIFQGTTGGAVSLFQTYAFNVLQQLHRHMEAGDKKSLAVFAGLQSTVFGFNGLPFFDAINTHIIGSAISNNPEHKDMYSVLPKFNKELGDWMLYGSASAFPLLSGSMPALYTRGDINPRHVTILPTNPLDVPAVQASIKAVTAVANFAKQAGGGADLSQAMLQGLEHQGLNRPLAGFAQLLNGQSTTSKGTLISAASDMETTTFLGGLKNRMIDYGGVSRLLGARPMDEAVSLNQMYRNKTYEALDKNRIERLGTVVKSKLYNNEVPTEEEVEDFMIRYTRSGGRIESFSQFMQRAYRDANQSVVNQTMLKVNSSTGRKMMDLMGGDMLPDYRNQLDGFGD